MGFFKIHAFEQTAYFQFCKITEFCLILVRFIYIDPEQLYDINSFKGLFIYVCQTMCAEKSNKFATYSERHNCMTC